MQALLEASMQNQSSGTARPAVDPRDVAPTRRDDVKQVLDTGLPPGIQPEELEDPGGKTPGANPNTRHGEGKD
jgi:hypothetical protein